MASQDALTTGKSSPSSGRKLWRPSAHCSSKRELWSSLCCSFCSSLSPFCWWIKWSRTNSLFWIAWRCYHFRFYFSRCSVESSTWLTKMDPPSTSSMARTVSLSLKLVELNKAERWLLFSFIFLANVFFFARVIGAILGDTRSYMRQKCLRFYLCCCLCMNRRELRTEIEDHKC